MYKNIEYKNIEILLIEDSLSDIRLTKEALKGIKMKNNLHVVSDGELAIDFLFKKNDFKDKPTPDLILLDLNLPKLDGIEVLRIIKSEKNLKLIPIVVLSTSSAEEDIVNSYNLNANCFITKPIDLNSFLEIIKNISDFWLSIVKLPPKQ